MGNLGDMFDPMGGGGLGSMDEMSSAGDMLDPMSGFGGAGNAFSTGADSSGATSSSNWEAAASSSSDAFGPSVMKPFDVLERMLNMVEDDEEEMCTICFDNLANGCLKPCGHQFCGDCIKQLKKRAVFLATEGVMCPHCRQPVKVFQLPDTIVPSVSTTKSAWGASAPAPAPAPIPQPSQFRAPLQPKPGPKQSNGPAAPAAPKAAAAATPAAAPAPAPKAAPAPPPPQARAPSPAPAPAPPPSAPAPALRVESQDAFSAFGSGSADMSPWSAGGGSLQMPTPSTAIGGFGGLGGGGGWSSTAFSGLPGLDTTSVFSSGTSGGLWGGVSNTATSGVLETWNAQGGGPSAFDSGSWDSFQMPGAGASNAGGGLGSGFGGGLGLSPLGSSSRGSSADPSVGNIEIKVKFSDDAGRDKDIALHAMPSDSGKTLRMKIKQLTNRPITGQTLLYQGKVIKPEDTVEEHRLSSGAVLQCFPRPTTDDEESDALKGEGEDPSSRIGLGGMAMLAPGAVRGGGAIGMQQLGRGLGAIGGSGLMSMDDDGRSDGRSDGSGSAGRGAGLSQDDDDWEAVGKKKKAAKGGGVISAGPGVPYNNNVSAVSSPAQALDSKQSGKARDGKMHFFGLWVGNVHSQVVDQDELRQCFERFGELCNSKAHGVPPINILPDSSSAFVNFCRYEDADAARNALQGRTVAGTGDLS